MNGERQREIQTFLEAVHQKWGYDFSNYAEASLTRRINYCLSIAGKPTLSEFTKRVAQDERVFNWFLEHFTVNVTEMFRDPPFYKMLREEVLPFLATYPRINIWHAGCSTGEEVYSLAILLQEAGLLHRCSIYASDLNPANLEKAHRGIVPISAIRDYTQNYRLSGGTEDFSLYYTAQYEYALIKKSLHEAVHFFPHNLATDGVFHEFQLVLCRNVLIYFNRELQERVLTLFTDSLAGGGFLALGTKESIAAPALQNQYNVLSRPNKVFRKKRAG